MEGVSRVKDGADTGEAFVMCRCQTLCLVPFLMIWRQLDWGGLMLLVFLS